MTRSILHIELSAVKYNGHVRTHYNCRVLQLFLWVNEIDAKDLEPMTNYKLIV